MQAKILQTAKKRRQCQIQAAAVEEQCTNHSLKSVFGSDGSMLRSVEAAMTYSMYRGLPESKWSPRADLMLHGRLFCCPGAATHQTLSPMSFKARKSCNAWVSSRQGNKLDHGGGTNTVSTGGSSETLSYLSFSDVFPRGGCVVWYWSIPYYMEPRAKASAVSLFLEVKALVVFL